MIRLFSLCEFQLSVCCFNLMCVVSVCVQNSKNINNAVTRGSKICNLIALHKKNAAVQGLPSSWSSVQ